jgi:signal transduction histidine kinase
LLLAAATLIPVGALGWLGLRTLEQDRALTRQRQRELLEVASERAALAIERRLQEIEDRLVTGSGLHYASTGITSTRDIPIVFQPIETASPDTIPALVAAETEEFQRRNLAGAEVEYERLTTAMAADVRAAALVGLGRVRRLRGNAGGALHAYAALERLGRANVAGQPAALVARQGRCRVLEASGDDVGRRAAASDLSRALASGDWPIDRATFDLYRGVVQRCGGTLPSNDDVARTEAAIDLWRAWRRGELAPRGRRLLSSATGSVLALWAGDEQQLTVWLATGRDVDASWQSMWADQKIQVALSGIDGQPFVGRSVSGGVSLAPSETRLPMILTVSSRVGAEGEDTVRSRLLIIGLSSVLVLVVGATYALYRTTTRELALARQQTEFVSAVSHEFRTPLTSMRHLTELLVSRPPTTEDRRRHYYELLANETERLHRMVESLLSFGRMDAGAYAWQLEPVDLGGIVRDIADEFRREALARGREVTCKIEDRLPAVRADRDALSRALWNLLENAGKYSEPGRPIHVFARSRDDAVLVGVRDEGIGIAATEHRRIFQKFVRGVDATRDGVRGVGLGLALVTRIVEAHGGSVRLESQPGHGSTFTLVLPCLES